MGKFNRWFGLAFDLDFQILNRTHSFGGDFSSSRSSLKLNIIKYRELLYDEFMVGKKK